jgi:hypothetical protein
MRFPVNFKDSTLMAVAPVGVKIQITAQQGIEAKSLAQGLQLLCSTYAREATGADPSSCIGQFVAINPTSSGAEEVDLLRFQSVSGTQPSVTRLIDWADFQSSQYPTSHLSWSVGEQMSNKEFVLFGSDDNAYALSDYSFNNDKCEHDRFFRVDLTHQVGYSPNVVAEGRSSLTVRVEDDDFYGRVQLAAIDSGRLVPLNSLDASAQTVSMPKIDWNSDTVDTPFSMYLMRSRTPAESSTERHRAVTMKPLRAWIKVDLGTLNTNEFRVEVVHIHGAPDQVVQTISSFTSAEVIAGDGTI